MKNKTQELLWDYASKRDKAQSRNDVQHYAKKYKQVYCELRGNVCLALDLDKDAYEWFNAAASIWSY